MKTTFKKNEILFYLSYITLYVSLFIGDIYNADALDVFARYLRLCSYAVIFLSCINLKLRKKELIQLLFLLVITLLYAMKTYDLYWSILILLIYNSKIANIENIYKISIRILWIGIVSVLFFCLIGILPDILTSRDTIGQIEFNRHSFGFYHSNVLPLLIFYLEAYYICLTKDKAREVVIALYMIMSVVVNSFCHSRNGQYLSLFLSIFIIFVRRIGQEKCKVLYKAAMLSVPIMSVFSFSMMFLLLKGGIWNTIDSFFSGRFRLAIFKMRRVGIHLINIMSNKAFINDNILYVNEKKLRTVVIDNGYLYIILRYGILVLLFYFLVAYLLAKKNKENICVLGTLIAVFIANFVDNDLVDYSFFPFILWAFNDWKNVSVIKNVKGKVNEIYKWKRMKI